MEKARGGHPSGMPTLPRHFPYSHDGPLPRHSQRQNLKHTQKSISKYVTRSLTTIYSLQNSLDFDKGGSISINLFQLYEFCRCQIIKSFTNNENKKLKKAYDALNIIIGAWQEIKIK